MAKQNPKTGSSLVRLARTNPDLFAKRMARMKAVAIRKGIRTPQSYQPKAPRRQLGFAAGPRTQQAIRAKAGIKAFHFTTDADALKRAGVSPLVAKGILLRAQKQGKLDKFATITKLPKGQGGVVKKLNLQAVKNEQERFRKISAKGKQKLTKAQQKIADKRQKQAQKEAGQAQKEAQRQQKQTQSNVQKANVRTGAHVATGAYIAGKAMRAISSIPGMLRRGGNYRF